MTTLKEPPEVTTRRSKRWISRYNSKPNVVPDIIPAGSVGLSALTTGFLRTVHTETDRLIVVLATDDSSTLSARTLRLAALTNLAETGYAHRTLSLPRRFNLWREAYAD